MESMNVLDITIRYFNAIVFVLCVLFGMTSIFASWIAWREIHRKKNIIRSVIAAYNIAEDTLEKGRTPTGDFNLDPAIVQTVFFSMQEVLNAIHGEITGKSVPPRNERTHGSGRLAAFLGRAKAAKQREAAKGLTIDTAAPPLIPEDREHHHSVSHP